MSPNEERRSSIRRRAPLCVPFRLIDDPASSFRQALVRDLSNLGIGLILPESLPLSALVEIELRSTRSLIVRPVQARVVHAVKEMPKSWIVGCAFTSELSADELGYFRAQKVRPEIPDGRRWLRFPCNVETVCYTAETTPGERRPARVLNVSPGGIGLLLRCQFSQGTLLHFELPAEADQPARDLLVRVVRVIEQSEGMWFLGCEFARQIDEDELRMFVRTNA